MCLDLYACQCVCLRSVGAAGREGDLDGVAACDVADHEMHRAMHGAWWRGMVEGALLGGMVAMA